MMYTRAFNPSYNDMIGQKCFLLFVLLELLVIISSFFLSYKFVLIVVISSILLLLSFLDVRISLLLAIAFSTLIQYGAKEKTLLEMSILTLIFIFFLLATYAKFCLEGLKIRRSKLDFPLIVLILISIGATFRGIFSSYNVALAGFELYAFLCFGVIFFVENLCYSPSTIRRLFFILVLVAYYSAFIGLIAYLKAGHRIGGHLFGAFPSMIALVFLNLSFYSEKKRDRFLYLMISAPLILHLIFSFTRGYWFGFSAGLTISYAFFVWQTKNTGAKKLLIFMRGILLSGILIFILMILASSFFPVDNLPIEASRRLESSFKWVPFSSAFARLVEYKACFEKIKENPILGHGFGYVLEYRDPLFPKASSQWYIHQSYLYITLKMGILGLVAFLWLFYVFFKSNIRNCMRIQNAFYKGLAFGFICNAIQLLISGLTNYEFAAVINTCYLAFAMGAVIVINQAPQNALQILRK